MKLYRVLQSQGFGSRKACRLRIHKGEMMVDGVMCDDPDAEFDTADLAFTVDGETRRYRERAYVLLHKPAGYECSHRPSHHPSVFALLPQPLIERGAQCVGRLDQDTTGLLLFSDDGQFIHRMISPKKGVAKAYRATCAEPLTEEMPGALRTGVQLNDEPEPIAALACAALAARTLRLVLAEGKYHQVRRMIAAAGNQRRSAPSSFPPTCRPGPGAGWMQKN